MKRIALIAVLMVMIASLFVACFHDDEAASIQVPDIPDLSTLLSGDWFGTGEFTPPEGGDPTNVTFLVQVGKDEDGELDVLDFLIDGVSISVIAGTTIESEISNNSVDPLVTESNVIVVEFAPGNGLSSGGLIFDDDFEHAFFFIHNEEDGSDVAYGVLTKNKSDADLTTFSTNDIVFSTEWTGSDYLFEYMDLGGGNWDIDFLSRQDNWRLGFTAPSSSTPNTIPFRGTTGGSASIGALEILEGNGSLDLIDTEFGQYSGQYFPGNPGSIDETVIHGYLSVDKQFFGGFIYNTEPGFEFQWSDIVLTKTP
jgi:hypothetical protein